MTYLQFYFELSSDEKSTVDNMIKEGVGFKRACDSVRQFRAILAAAQQANGADAESKALLTVEKPLN